MIWGIIIVVSFVIGLICGISFTMYLIRKGIREADIASDQKCFVQDLLGIRP